jgi:hypothetical protein
MKVVDRDGDFNFVLLIGLAGLLIAVGFTVGAFRRPEDLARPLVWVAAGIAVACLGSTGFILREQAREDRFRAWLLEHRNELYQGGASYHGITLDAESPIYRYTYMFSLGVVRFTVPGRPLVLGLDDLRRARRGYNIVTFLFGWWFITGPLFTPLVLYRNFKSPQPISIAEYMHNMGRSGPVGVA